MADAESVAAADEDDEVETPFELAHMRQFTNMRQFLLHGVNEAQTLTLKDERVCVASWFEA